MATQKTWSYDDAKANFGKTDRIMQATGLDKFYAAGGSLNPLGDDGGINPNVGNEYTPGKQMGRTWNDILRDNAVQLLGPQAANMTPQQHEQIARQQGILGGKETSWGEDIMEGLKGPLLLPAAFTGAGLATGAFSGAGASASAAGGAMDMGIGGVGESMGLGGGAAGGAAGYNAALDPALAGGGEVGSGYAASASGAAPSLMSYVPDAVKAMGQSAVGDWLKKNAGSLIAAGLGAYGSSQQAGQYDSLAREYAGYGAPYRQRLADLYRNPSSFLNSAEVRLPIEQAASINARALSTGGNPIGSGNAMQQMNDFTATKLFSRLGEEKDRLAGFGGLSSYNAAAPGAASNAINANSGVYNAIGAGVNNIFNPTPTLAETMADFKRLSQGL